MDQSNCREQIIVSQLQPRKPTKQHCLNIPFVSAHQQDKVPAQMPFGFQIYGQAPSTGLVALLLSSKIQFAISHLFLKRHTGSLRRQKPSLKACRPAFHGLACLKVIVQSWIPLKDTGTNLPTPHFDIIIALTPPRISRSSFSLVPRGTYSLHPSCRTRLLTSYLRMRVSKRLYRRRPKTLR